MLSAFLPPLSFTTTVLPTPSLVSPSCPTHQTCNFHCDQGSLEFFSLFLGLFLSPNNYFLNVRLSMASSAPSTFDPSRQYASTAHMGTSFVGLTHSNYLGSWVLNSRTTNHIIGNKSFFFSLTNSGCLPFTTMAALGPPYMVELYIN